MANNLINILMAERNDTIILVYFGESCERRFAWHFLSLDETVNGVNPGRLGFFIMWSSWYEYFPIQTKSSSRSIFNWYFSLWSIEDDCSAHLDRLTCRSTIAPIWRRNSTTPVNPWWLAICRAVLSDRTMFTLKDIWFVSYSKTQWPGCLKAGKCLIKVNHSLFPLYKNVYFTSFACSSSIIKFIIEGQTR